MAIQATKSLKHNHATYESPYFRIVMHYLASGEYTVVDCHMYPSKDEYDNPQGSMLATIPFYINNEDVNAETKRLGAATNFLLEISKAVKVKLEEMFPESSFEITGIVQEENT
jgi:hypothetical protein